MEDTSVWLALRSQFYIEKTERNTSIYLTLGINSARCRYLLWTIDEPLSARQCEAVLNSWFLRQDFLVLEEGVLNDD